MGNSNKKQEHAYELLSQVDDDDLKVESKDKKDKIIKIELIPGLDFQCGFCGYQYEVCDKKLKCAKCSIISTNNGNKDGIFKELDKTKEKGKEKNTYSLLDHLSGYVPKSSSSGYGNAMFFLAISRGFK